MCFDFYFGLIFIVVWFFRYMPGVRGREICARFSCLGLPRVYLWFISVFRLCSSAFFPFCAAGMVQARPQHVNVVWPVWPLFPSFSILPRRCAADGEARWPPDWGHGFGELLTLCSSFLRVVISVLNFFCPPNCSTITLHWLICSVVCGVMAVSNCFRIGDAVFEFFDLCCFGPHPRYKVSLHCPKLAKL